MKGNENISTKAMILERLRADSACVSGEELSRELEISRTSVWKAVQALRASGYEIESFKNGYVLKDKNSDSICPVEFGKEENIFTHFKTVGSTMDEARRIALDSLSDGGQFLRIVTADEQSAGKGRGNHDWKTTKGSLAFTMVTYPELSTNLLARQIMAAQIALVNVLEEMSGRRFYARWPNDVWSGDGKVAGILDEELSSGGRCRFMNLGIGVNVTKSPGLKGTDKVFGKAVPQSRKKILTAFHDEFLRLETLVLAQGSELSDLWNKINYDSGRTVRAFGGGEYIFEKIDGRGYAVLSTAAERSRKIFAPGEISYEKN